MHCLEILPELIAIASVKAAKRVVLIIDFIIVYFVITGQICDSYNIYEIRFFNITDDIF